MIFLVLCILINSYISVIFKLFENYGVNTLPAIILNYPVTIITASIMLGNAAITKATFNEPWIWAAMILGFCFVTTFNLFALTVQKFSVVTGSIFQKMSLIAPVIVAILIFDEGINLMKIIGIACAIIAIFLITMSNKSTSDNNGEQSSIPLLYWLYPIGTFIGSCMIDTGLYYVNEIGLADSADIDFVASIFFFAGIFGSLLLLSRIKEKTSKIRGKEFIASLALGIPNFFSIWLILKILTIGIDASVVFPINNTGILVVSAILGLVFFKESVNKQKVIGFISAIIAIVLIAIA